jgi:hypothetical protein
VRPLPLPADLARFLEQCRALDQYAIARCLVNRAAGAPVPVATRALFVLEALLRTGSDEVDDAVNDYPEPLFDAELSEARALQLYAARCLVHAGLRDEADFQALVAAGNGAAAVPTAAPVAPPTPTTAPPSIHGHAQSNAAAAALAAAAASAPSDGGFDLFGLLNTSDQPAVSSGVSAFDPLGLNSVSAPARAVAASTAIVDDNGDDDDDSAEASAFDFISDDAAPAPTTRLAAPAAAGGLFSNMSMKKAGAADAPVRAAADPFAGLNLSSSSSSSAAAAVDPLAALLGTTSLSAPAPGPTGANLAALLSAQSGPAYGAGVGAGAAVDPLAMLYSSSSSAGAASNDPFADVQVAQPRPAPTAAAAVAGAGAQAPKKAGPDSFSFVNDMM